jgi:hypothetical protein
MSMEYIRKAYGVPAKRGGKVKIISSYKGCEFEGVITGSKGSRVLISINKGRSGLYHPTDGIVYL